MALRTAWFTVRAACSWLRARGFWAWILDTGDGPFQAAAEGAGVWGEGLPVTIDLTVVAAALAEGQVGLRATAHCPVLADAGCAGIRLPVSPLRTGAPQPPALGRGGAALTGRQLPHSGLQVLILLLVVMDVSKPWGLPEDSFTSHGPGRRQRQAAEL